MTLKFLLCTFLILVSLSYGNGQIFSAGSCPKVNVTKDFNLNQFTGVWYEIYRTPRYTEEFGKCISFKIEAEADKVTFNINIKLIYQIVDIETNYTTQCKIAEPGHAVSPEGDLYVLSLNKEFAVLYLCNEFFAGQLHTNVVWILSRKTNLDESNTNNAYKIIEENDLSTFFLHTIDQTNCPAT